MRKLLYALWLFAPLVSDAQRYDADSVRKVLHQVDDTTRIQLIYEIGYSHAGNRLDSALLYYNEALRQSKAFGYKWGQCKYYGYASAIYHSKGEFDKSLSINREGLQVCTNLKIHDLEVNQYINIGNDFQHLQNYDSSVYYYLQAKREYERDNDSVGLTFVYGNIAEIYAGQKRKKEALAYARLSMRYCNKKDGYVYRNILFNMARDEYEMGYYDDAFIHFKEAETLAREEHDDFLMLLLMDAYFMYYNRFGKFEEMPHLADEFMRLGEPLQSDMITANGYYLKAVSCLYQKRFDESERYLYKMFPLTHEPDLLRPAYDLASDLALVDHDMRGYWRYLNMADSIRNIMGDERVLRNSQELERRYETQKKEQQLRIQDKEITQKKLWIIILVISIGALALVLVFAVVNYINKQKLQKQKIAQLESEKQLNATKAVLKGQDEERSRLAKDLHDGLGSMLSGVKFSFANIQQNMVMTSEMHNTFERSLHMLDTSIRELRSVAHNMMPEMLLKLGLYSALEDLCAQASQSGVKVVCQRIGLEKTFPQEVSINVYRIIQELVTNALKHAEASEVLVQLSLMEGTLSLTVEDNGKGFDVLNRGVGLGWSNIRNRIAAMQGSLDVKSGLGNGTSVFIQIPIKHD